MKYSYSMRSLLASAVIASTAAHAEAEDALPTITDRGLAIEEVVVTVSKRSESLQEVMGSVSAYSGDTLAQNNIQDFKTLADLVPGMIVQREDGGSDEVAIRGISRTRNGPSPVAFHVNDVFIAMRGEPYFDLAAVEILRGPSGTVFGRNATAGAINAKWRKPEAEWGFGGDARYSDLEEEQLRAYVNIPFLGEGDARLLGRFAAIKRRRDGTLDNTMTDAEADPGNIDDSFFRMYLTSEVTETLQLGLRAIRYESNPGGTSSVSSPSLATRRSGILEELGAQPMPDDLRIVRSTAHEKFGNSFDKYTRIDGDINWSLEGLPLIGDLDIVLVGGEQRREHDSVFDVDGTEAPILEGRTSTRDDIRRSAELRFVSQNDSGIDWLAGLFWFDSTQTRDRDFVARNFLKPSTFVPGAPDEPQIIADFVVTGRDEQILDSSEAVFANVNLDMATLFGWPNIELTAGVRHNRDSFTQKVGLFHVAADTGTLAGTVPIVDQQDVHQFADFSKNTGEVGGRWFYSDDGMLYAKYARGYKPGLAQLKEEPNGTTSQNPVDPEILDAWEAGWKTTFFDSTLQLNVAGFMYDYTGLQVSQVTAAGVITDNAAAATINGLEVDFKWSPTPELRIQGGFAWTDARYDEYCANDEGRADKTAEPGCEGAEADPLNPSSESSAEGGPFNVSGERLTAAPEFSTVLLASYRFDLGEFGSLTPSIKTNWVDWMDRRGLGNENDRVEAHTNSDVRLTWESLGGQVKIEGFVENIEDHDDIFFVTFTPLASTPGTYTLSGELPPRVYGVSLELFF